MIEVREGRLGKSVHAARRIEKDEVVIDGWGPTSSVRTRHTMQVDRELHVEIRTDLELINHSCEPNCGLLIRKEVPLVEIRALRAIEPGEELTMDYAAFEDDIQFMPGECLCGSNICRGRITGYEALPPERREALNPYIAAHLRELDSPVSRS